MKDCECECKTKIPATDSRGRPRRFVKGHEKRHKLNTNEQIPCGCGCGKIIDSVDKRNRPKKYSWGHAGRKSVKEVFCACGCKKKFTKKIDSTQIYIKNHHNKNAGFKKGYTPWNKGKNWIPPNIDEFIEGGKETRYKKGQLSKEKHHNWKGGITPVHVQIRNSEEGKNWRKAVFERDNYTCVKCGERGGSLVADHKKAFYKYPGLRFELSNGRTLCEKCNHESTYKLKEWKNS